MKVWSWGKVLPSMAVVDRRIRGCIERLNYESEIDKDGVISDFVGTLIFGYMKIIGSYNDGIAYLASFDTADFA